MNDNKQDINRIKVVLVEKRYTAKWFAEQLYRDQTTVPKWRTNPIQPGLESLLQIANILDVDVRTLIIQSKKNHHFIAQYTVYGATQTDKQHQ